MKKYTLGVLQNLHTICWQTLKWLLPEISFRIHIQFTDWITLRSIIPWNFLTERFCKWPVCHSVWNMHLQFSGKSIYFGWLARSSMETMQNPKNLHISKLVEVMVFWVWFLKGTIWILILTKVSLIIFWSRAFSKNRKRWMYEKLKFYYMI